MTRILKITDKTVGHSSDCQSCDGILTPLNQLVYSENVLVAVGADTFNAHPGACAHTTTINAATCSPNVFISGFRVAMEGSVLTCQDIATLNPTNQTFTNVFINN